MQFWFRFSVDFSPLFGLRAFGKLLVLLCFFALEGGLGPFFLGWIFVDFGLSLAADRLRNIAEDVKAFTLEIVFDVTQRAQRGTSQGTAVVKCVGGSSRSHP